MTSSMYCLYVGVDYTYIDVNALAQGICMYECMHVCMYVCMHACICVCMAPTPHQLALHTLTIRFSFSWISRQYRGYQYAQYGQAFNHAGPFVS